MSKRAATSRAKRSRRCGLGLKTLTRCTSRTVSTASRFVRASRPEPMTPTAHRPGHAGHARVPRDRAPRRRRRRSASQACDGLQVPRRLRGRHVLRLRSPARTGQHGDDARAQPRGRGSRRRVALVAATTSARCSGRCGSTRWRCPTDRHGSHVDVPLLLSNINDPRRAAEALTAGPCDRSTECLRRLLLNFPVRCHRNARMGRESRTGRGVPPTRFARRPVEEAVLALTGSERLMGLASKAARRK